VNLVPWKSTLKNLPSGDKRSLSCGSFIHEVTSQALRYHVFCFSSTGSKPYCYEQSLMHANGEGWFLAGKILPVCESRRSARLPNGWAISLVRHTSSSSRSETLPWFYQQ
jgi:hypothetical protein